MLSIYLIFGLIYVFFLIFLASFWQGSTPAKHQRAFLPSVSILIPFRNEIENLPVIFAQLSSFNYPRLEIIFIDDQSEDTSVEWLEFKSVNFDHISIVKSEGLGKKRAIQKGVQCAVGEVILCTDSDCSLSATWLEEMIFPFSNPSIQLVAGPVMAAGEAGFCCRFQQIDWASILLLTNFCFIRKKPLMCSAANLAYRKAAFLTVKGYQGNLEYSSGDDEFLLKKIVNEFGAESCTYIHHATALVYTKAEESWKSLYGQRVRWSSKWRAHGSGVHLLTALLSLGVQVIFLSSYGLLFVGIKGVLLFLFFWGLKISAEYHVLGKVLISFNKRLPLRDFILTSFIHPLYVIKVGLGGFSGKFTWKGRVNQRSVNLEPEK